MREAGDLRVSDQSARGDASMSWRSELTRNIEDAERKSKASAERASRARRDARQVEVDRAEQEAHEWKEEAAFLKTLEAIFEWQSGVSIRNEKASDFPLSQTGKGKAARWDYAPNPGKYHYQEWHSEAQGSFCHGTARAMALRALFGADKPSNKNILENLRDEIKKAEDDKTKAELVIDRICTHQWGDFALERYNRQLESRYNITNVKLLSVSEAKAKLALNQGAPIITGTSSHWVMVQKSPRGAFWRLDPLLTYGGVDKLSSFSELNLGGRFEIIVDAKTENPIGAIMAASYKKDSAKDSASVHPAQMPTMFKIHTWSLPR
jgi:hypothetical protein